MSTNLNAAFAEVFHKPGLIVGLLSLLVIAGILTLWFTRRGLAGNHSRFTGQTGWGLSRVCGSLEGFTPLLRELLVHFEVLQQ